MHPSFILTCAKHVSDSELITCEMMPRAYTNFLFKFC